MSIKAKTNDSLKSEKATLNESDTPTNEMKPFLKQEVEKNDCVEANCSTNNDSSYKTTLGKRNVGENHNHHESKRSIRSEKQ